MFGPSLSTNVPAPALGKTTYPIWNTYSRSYLEQVIQYGRVLTGVAQITLRQVPGRSNGNRRCQAPTSPPMKRPGKTVPGHEGVIRAPCCVQAAHGIRAILHPHRHLSTEQRKV
jgi:hypothetical protein